MKSSRDGKDFLNPFNRFLTRAPQTYLRITMTPSYAAPRLTRPPPVALRFGCAAILASAVAGALTLALGTPVQALAAVLICGGVLALATVALAHAAQSGAYPHDRVGLCNLVTLSRVALIASLAVPVVGGAPAAPVAWTLTGIAALALSLDGVDGWLARRARLTSAFGARFDMEVDALSGALLAIAALQSGKAGPWVLALGLMRYVFLAASLVWPWLGADLPPSQRRRVVCVIQIGALVLLLAPPVAPPVSGLIAMAATLALGWSFAVDVLWLRRNRG